MKRRPAVTKADGIAAAIIAGGLVLRLWINALGLPLFDSDEGTMGLMALHILRYGAHPVFFYGQAYMGALEAYLGAVSFRLFGVSDVTLRLASIFITGVFLCLAYWLTCLLYGRGSALPALGILSLGSAEALAREIRTVGGYPEMLLFGTAALLIASSLAISDSLPATQRRLLCGLWGLAVALGLWSDPLVLPFDLTSGLLLLAFCRQELRGWAGAVALLGLAIGLLPVTLYNLSVSPGQSTVASVLAVMHAGGSGHTVHASAPLPQRLAGVLAVSLPVVSGGNALCGLSPQAAWPLTARSGLHAAGCTAVHVAWSVGLISLWIAAATVAGRSLLRRAGERAQGHEVGDGSGGYRENTERGLSDRFRTWEKAGTARAAPDRALDPSPTLVRLPPVDGPPPRDAWSVSPGNSRARDAARLAVLGGAALTVLLYCLSPAPAHAPWYTVRYLTGIWIAVPAIISPLTAPFLARLEHGRGRLGAMALLVLVGIALATSDTSLFGNLSYATWLNGQLRQAAGILGRHHVQHVYTDYWTCDWLAFETTERITCSVLDAHLGPGLDRYLPYRVAVRQDLRAWYVFRIGLPAGQTMARYAARHPDAFRVIALPAFELYEPTSSLTGGPASSIATIMAR
ncbi:MAG TPA: hypothetical protein VFB58_18780 [Chloroflexota bacterium]|nr:hypothetical protein [Chloroflexota bacterium]